MPLCCTLNGQPVTYHGDPDRSLLSWLRGEQELRAAKDGCSGQAACGACLVEVNGKACLACSTPMRKVDGATILTLEGFPENLRQTLGQAFVRAGAVQCGFCTPGFLCRAKILLATNPDPSREEVTKAVRPHLCRCTGYVKLVDAILDAAKTLREGRSLSAADQDARPGVGSDWPKYAGYERAVGQRPFVDDLRLDALPGLSAAAGTNAGPLLHGALLFSEHPRARVLALHTDAARALPGVIRVITAADIPGERHVGMFVKDWPVYVAVGEVTRYIGDVLACVVAESEAVAREAVRAIRVEYEVLEPLLDMDKAETSPIRIHEKGNVLLDKRIQRGDPADDVLARCAHRVEATFETQPVEHGFIEPEAALALPEGEGIRLYVQAQGIWHDRADVAALLNLPPENVTVTLVDAGGAFGGKEDMTCQGHAALAAWLLRRAVKVRLSRP